MRHSLHWNPCASLLEFNKSLRRMSVRWREPINNAIALNNMAWIKGQPRRALADAECANALAPKSSRRSRTSGPCPSSANQHARCAVDLRRSGVVKAVGRSN